MDKEFLRTLSDLELVKLQHEARGANDTKLVNDILAVLGEREKQNSTPERLNYMRLSETEFEYKIMMQFDGGGAMLKIDKNDNSKTIADKLRYFAELLEQSVAERAGNDPGQSRQCRGPRGDAGHCLGKLRG
jgi:hypothetical protein